MRSFVLLGTVLLGTVALLVACGGTATTFPDGSGGSGASGAGSGSGASGAGTSTSNGGSMGDGGSTGTTGGPMCDIEPRGDVLCVRGQPNDNGTGEALRAGGTVTFEVYPEGCYSGSCTKTLVAECNVVSEAVGELVVSEEFCLDDTSDQGAPCTDDCGGAELASCELDGVAQGRYSVTMGDVSLSFDVPSQLPVGGQCEGRPE